MPFYNSNVISNSPVICLAPGESFTLFNREAVLTGQFSQQVAIGLKESGVVPAISLELSFTTVAGVASDPGAFDIEVQDADVDVTTSYITVPAGGVVVAAPVTPSGAFMTRVELSPFDASFLRLWIKTQPANPVFVTAKVRRA